MSPDPPTEREAKAQRRIDLVSTLLLAFATLATAWAGYQAARWHSEQAKHQQKANASRIESTRSADDANREAQIDISLYFEWVDAHLQGDAELADFYRARFTDRLAPEFEKWIASKPFARPGDASSPFTARYETALTQDAATQAAAADTAGAAATEDIDRADRYVLAVVLFASCLFLAGLSTRIRGRTGQAVILALGCVVFVGTAAWIATFPVTVAF